MAITYLSGQRIQGLSNASGGSALFEGSENAQNTSVPVLGAGEFTVACWIYPTANDAYNHFISSYSSGAGDNWALLTKAGVVEFYNQSDTQPSSSITIAIDTWHHVAIKRDSSDALFFVVDGVVVDPSVTRTTSYGGTTFSVGGLVGASGQNFDGNISDVAYWDKAISDAKLQAIYNDKTLAGDTDSDDLVAYFPLSSDFTDSKASYDLTNNGGTITSTTWELNEREKVTDVPVGSQFEETDTRKFYQISPTVQTSNQNEDDNIAFNPAVGASKYGYKFASDHYLVGRTVKSVWYKIKSTGTQSAGVLSVYAGQSASTGNNTLIGSVNATAISESEYTWYEFTGSGTHEIVANDHIWLTISTTATVNCGVRYFANAPTYGAIPYDFWGSGDALPDGNTLGTTDAGTTYVTYRNTSVVTDPDTVAPVDGATTAHPMIIKVDSTPPAWIERGTAL